MFDKWMCAHVSNLSDTDMEASDNSPWFLYIINMNISKLNSYSVVPQLSENMRARKVLI